MAASLLRMIVRQSSQLSFTQSQKLAARPLLLVRQLSAASNISTNLAHVSAPK